MLACSLMCDRAMVCGSFAYNKREKICVLQFMDLGDPDYAPLTVEGYDWFEETERNDD